MPQSIPTFFAPPDYLYYLRKLPVHNNYPADHILFCIDGTSLYTLSYAHGDHYVIMPLTEDQKQRNALPQLVDTDAFPSLDFLAGSAILLKAQKRRTYRPV